LKTLLKIIIFVAIAILVAFGASSINQSHVIMFIRDYRVDLSLTTLLIGFFVFFIVCYYILRIIFSIQDIPESIRAWSKYRAVEKKRQYLDLAMISFFAGDEKKAYKTAVKVLDSRYKERTDYTFLALSIAIKTASSMKNVDKDKLLKDLEKYDSHKFKLAIEKLHLSQNI
jgi:uncharacterized protein HemY